MAANSIATAYVQILPTTSGITSGIGSALGGSAAAAAASGAGSVLGGVMGGALGSTLTKLFPKLGLAGAVAGMVGFGKASVETGMQFEASMSRVYALMTSANDGAGLTAAQMSTLSNRAREMGSTTQFTASQCADAMYYMALAGWDVQEIYSGVPEVLNLAAASGMDLGRASDIVTDYMGAFSQTAPTAAHLVDVLAYAQSHSNATTEQFAQAWQYSAGMLNAFGQTADTGTAILARLANQGHKASTGGVELNAVLTSMYQNMDKNGDIQFNGQLIHMADENGKFRNLIDIFGDMQRALGGDFNAEELENGLNSVEKAMEGLDPSSAEYAETMASAIQTLYSAGGEGGISPGTVAYISTLAGLFGNVRGMRGIQAILNGDVGEMQDFEDQLEGSEGEANKQREKMNDNLVGDLKLLASATDELKIQVASVLMPVLRSVVQGLTSFVNWLNGRSDNPIETFAGDHPESISETDAEKVGQRAQQLMNELKFGELTPEQRQAYMDELTGMIESIESLPTNESGENVVAGIAQGMTDYSFDGDAETVKSNIIATIDSALQAHSPAQALVPTGTNAAMGIMQGMTEYDYTTGALPIVNSITTALGASFAMANWETASQATAQGLAAGVAMKTPLLESASAQLINAAYNKVASLVGAGGSGFRKFGYDIALGIAAGIADGSSEIADALSDALMDGLKDAKEKAGVGSPSRLFAEELGRWIPAGVAMGITDNADTIGSALGDTLSDATVWNGSALPMQPGGGFVQHVTVNSPTALTPWEVARQTRNATRQMALAMRRKP